MKKCLIKKSLPLLGVFLLVAAGQLGAMENEKEGKPPFEVGHRLDRSLYILPVEIDVNNVWKKLPVMTGAIKSFNNHNKHAKKTNWPLVFVDPSSLPMKFLYQIIRDEKNKENVARSLMFEKFEESLEQSVKDYVPFWEIYTTAAKKFIIKKHGDMPCIKKDKNSSYENEKIRDFYIEHSVCNIFKNYAINETLEANELCEKCKDLFNTYIKEIKRTLDEGEKFKRDLNKVQRVYWKARGGLELVILKEDPKPSSKYFYYGKKYKKKEEFKGSSKYFHHSKNNKDKEEFKGSSKYFHHRKNNKDKEESKGSSKYFHHRKKKRCPNN